MGDDTMAGGMVPGRGYHVFFFFPFLFSSLSRGLVGGWEGGRAGGREGYVRLKRFYLYL